MVLGMMRWRLIGLTGVLAVTAVACSRADESSLVVDREPAPQEDAVALTIEEAGLIASGELVEIYGRDADPVPVRVDRRADTLGAQQVWRLDLLADVTVESKRATHRWVMWVGTPTDGDPAVLRARRTDP
jgi:hypothetical protein